MITLNIKGSRVQARKHLHKWTLSDFATLGAVLAASQPDPETGATINTLNRLNRKFQEVQARPLRLGDIQDIRRMLEIVERNWPSGDGSSR